MDLALSLEHVSAQQDSSRQDTTLRKTFYLAASQLGLEARPGSRAWVRHGLRLRVVEGRKDAALAADIVKRRHYLGRWPVPPKKLVLGYLADLAGAGPGDAGAAGLVQVSCLPQQNRVFAALELAQYEVLTLVRTWRADDLTPDVVPNLTPELLRRVVKGSCCGAVRPLREEWLSRKCRPDGLRAAPRLLLTFADPARGHDGATYLAAGATFCGVGVQGKLTFAWALDEPTVSALKRWRQAVADRLQGP